MKKHHWWAWLMVAAAASTAWDSCAEQAAVVQAERVNVRGKPSTLGEVITQLKHGETVTILEEIPIDKPKPGEPARWAKIKMPENTPLWVNATFIDPTNKTVKVGKLNVRAGGGENYSTVGRLEKGAVVKEIRVVDDWMEIETPTNAYAYVASDLLAKQEPAPGTPEPSNTAAAPKPIAPVPPPEIVKAEPATPAPTEPVATPRTAPAAPPSLEPAKTEPPKSQPAPAVAAPVAAPAPAPVEPKLEGPPPKRIVTREGVVRRTVSIQAPTAFELRSGDTHKPLDYLHTSASHLVLKKFNGKKVIVTGEELIDPRWPQTPVLEIDTIQVAP